MFVIPSTAVRRQPSSSSFRTLQSAALVDQLLTETLGRLSGAADRAAAAQTPSMDVQETDAGYILAFDLPGAAKQDLQVAVEGRRVSIETKRAVAEKAAPEAGDVAAVAAPRTLYRERKEPHFARTVSLPAEVDHANAQARFDNGVLTLTLAKKVPTGATQITVN